jgi:hypothetical protein
VRPLGVLREPGLRHVGKPGSVVHPERLPALRRRRPVRRRERLLRRPVLRRQLLPGIPVRRRPGVLELPVCSLPARRGLRARPRLLQWSLPE